VSSLTPDLVPKRLETLKALAPGVRRVWAVHHGADTASSAGITRARELSVRLGMEIVPQAVLTTGDLEHVLERVGPHDGFLVPDVAALDISAALLEASLARRVPAVFPSELWVSRGGLVSFGADYRAQGVQAARLVGKILRGAPPRDLPVEQAEPLVLAVNLKTAASLGLVAPRRLLFRADIIRR
jgi:putative ABC transport system substrate-binding protein